MDKSLNNQWCGEVFQFAALCIAALPTNAGGNPYGKPVNSIGRSNAAVAKAWELSGRASACKRLIEHSSRLFA